MAQAYTKLLWRGATHAVRLTPGFAPRLRAADITAGSSRTGHSSAGCSHWVSGMRYASTSTKAEPEASLVIEEGAEFFDEVEICEDEEWELGEEVSEGVFVSQAPETEVGNAATASAAATSSAPKRKPPTSIKHMNRLLSRHQVPDLPESELEEKFVRGRGPGGQAINKTNSSVSLVHIPTGIRVQAQPTRSREQNRHVARQILKERLDLMKARGELAGVDTALTAPGPHGPPQAPEKQSRKEKLAAEARSWSKQELRWEKERRRKLNRSKKVKKRKKGEDGDEAGSEE